MKTVRLERRPCLQEAFYGDTGKLKLRGPNTQQSRNRGQPLREMRTNTEPKERFLMFATPWLRQFWSRRCCCSSTGTANTENHCVRCFCASSVHSGPGCLDWGPFGTRHLILDVSPSQSPEDTSSWFQAESGFTHYVKSAHPEKEGKLSSQLLKCVYSWWTACGPSIWGTPQNTYIS